jgi:hypothetical protein
MLRCISGAVKENGEGRGRYNKELYQLFEEPDIFWSPNWVHSARRPLTGLLYLPRVIVRMENLVE